VVDEVARRRGVRLDREECKAFVGASDDGGLRLAKPLTYMNRSGYSARCLVERHAFEPGDLLVVYDEVALPLGRLRLRPGGSPAGHRGLESVIGELRSAEVPRLRLGIAAEEMPEELIDYVLSPFGGDEEATVDDMVERAADACEAWYEEGIEAAMNRFNAAP